ncbi:hypothetical protein TcasGA2_TC011032 [Tribolium castaneum]|uniref:Uncharacterized protein n=1 Tax=Tribolium castaneum TaxID=7070 RepID=D6X4V4_TRICA|nr:hypothetical protein TcasGA2_TC011032 [Tribolium castaneum]
MCLKNEQAVAIYFDEQLRFSVKWKRRSLAVFTKTSCYDCRVVHNLTKSPSLKLIKQLVSAVTKAFSSKL